MTPVELLADCSRCAGLCCTLLPFRAVDGFGVDKPGGEPCANLLDDHRCRIHERLLDTGWPGCVAYDCQGAGPQVTQVTYAGRDWRSGEVDLGEMAAVFSVVRVLHGELAGLDPRSPRYAALAAAAGGSPEELPALDLDELVGDPGQVSGCGATPRPTGPASAGPGRAAC